MNAFFTIQPHKRAAARFAKKIADPTFDRSTVMDPRDISIQIEEEIRMGSSSRTAPAKDPKTQKRDKANTKKETTKKDSGSSDKNAQAKVRSDPCVCL